MPSRREFVQRSAIVGGALAGMGSASACASNGTPQRSALESAVIPARGTASAIKQSVCRWCFNDMPLDELAANAKRIGLHSVELIGPADFPTIKKHGLMCAMVSQAGNGGIPRGWNRVDNHGWLIPAYQERIAAVAAEKWPNVICFSGNRDGLGDDEGRRTARGTEAAHARGREAGVTLCMELLNSKVDHPDYQCDHTRVGREARARRSARRGSSCSTTSTTCRSWRATSSARSGTTPLHRPLPHRRRPGRHEIDETQELNYPAVMKAIADTGYTATWRRSSCRSRKSREWRRSKTRTSGARCSGEW